MKTQTNINNESQACEVLSPVEFFTTARATALGLEKGNKVKTSEGVAMILGVVADKIRILLNGRTVLREIEELA